MRKLTLEELNRCNPTEYAQREKISVTIVLDNIRSAHNVGSIFRTADAFLIERMYLCGITAQPPDKEIHKTALGATDTVKWMYSTDTETALHELKSQGYNIIAIEQVENGITLNDFIPVKGLKYAVVFGNEVNGVSQNIVNIADTSIEIPQFGTKHSLNVSVCAGIVIWDLFNKLKQ